MFRFAQLRPSHVTRTKPSRHQPSSMPTEDVYECDECGKSVPVEDAIRSKTYGDLDPDKWQTLNCPQCKARLATVFVGDE